jgi:hypothetical protein
MTWPKITPLEESSLQPKTPQPKDKDRTINSVERYGKRGYYGYPMGAAYATSVGARQNLSTSGTAVPNTLKERKWSR